MSERNITGIEIRAMNDWRKKRFPWKVKNQHVTLTRPTTPVSYTHLTLPTNREV